MADRIVVGESREQVALALFKIVAKAEGKNIDMPGSMERDYILSTYFECLQVAIGYEPTKK